MNKIKNIFNTNFIKLFIILLIVLQPIIDMDVYLFEVFNSLNIPLFSTVIRFILIPLLIIVSFLVYDKNKKRSFILASIYTGALLVYFYFHCTNAIAIRDELYLTKNFYFSVFQELTYLMTMCLPYYMVYAIFESQLKEKGMKIIAISLSTILSFPILLSNLLVFGHSTYTGYTQMNIFSWFTGASSVIDPRQLSSKFFFIEGNTIGILMFMLLPILYYFLYNEKNKKTRNYLLVLVFVHSISMIILSTRIGTYGCVLGAIAFLVIVIACRIFDKKFEINRLVIIFALAIITICSIIIPYSPSIINQGVDRGNNQAVIDDNYILEEGRGQIEELLNQPKDKYDPSLVYKFEAYGIKSNLMSYVPAMYYMDWYKYTYDAYFWLNVMTLPFDQRINGRQIQTLFIEYKWAETPNPTVDHAIGLGYSTMMNGSLILESDFIQQFYSFGYVGFILIVMPWILFVIYGVINLLCNFKKLFKFDILIYATSLVFGLVAAYVSGHTLDEFTTNIFLALLVAMLLRSMYDYKKKGE